MKKIIAIIISAALVFTSVPFIGNGYSYAQNETVITNELLDEMAEDWKETCEKLHDECGVKIVENGLGLLDLPDSKEEILPYTFEIGPGIIEAYLEKDEFEELLKEEDMGSSALMDKKKEKLGTSLKDFILENYTYLACMVVCDIAKKQLTEAIETADFSLKKQQLIKGAKWGTVACVIAMEEIDAMIKDAGLSDEDLMIMIKDVGIDAISKFYPEMEYANDIVTVVYDIKEIINQVEAKCTELKAYENGQKEPENDEYAFLNCIVNKYGNYEMSFSPSGAILQKYNGYLLNRKQFADLVIPEDGLYGYKIIRINRGFADGNTFPKGAYLESIIIPSTIVELEGGAFVNHKELNNIKYNAVAANNSLTSAVIDNCPQFTNLDISNNVKSIPPHFVSNCGLNKIDIPDSVTSIALAAFENALLEEKIDPDNPATLDLGEGVQFIGTLAFKGYHVGEVTIPESVTQIQGEAFGYTDQLTKVNYNAISVNNPSVSAIIRYCPQFTNLEIGKNVKSIPQRFVSDSGLKKIIIPNNVQSIGAMAFENALSKDKINPEEPATLNLGKGVQFIGASAFKGYPVGEVTIPESVTQIQGEAFGYNNQLTKVNYNAISVNNPSVSAIIRYCPQFTDLEIGKNVKSIPQKFVSDSGLNKIDIPGNVESIGAMAFENALSKDKINPEEPATLNLGKGVQFIGASAFKLYPVEEVTIPESVKELQGEAFSYNDNLKTVNFNAVSSTTPSTGASIRYCANLTELNIGENVKAIPMFLISDCGITDVIIPKWVQSIGYSAFDNNPHLSDITILNKETAVYNHQKTISSNAKIHGYENSTAHTYATKYGRAFEAIVCNHKNVLTEKIESTCTETGSEQYICSVCDEESVVETSALGHSWNQGEVTQKATCTENGEITYTCTRDNCNETKTEPIAAKHTEVVIPAVAATCTTDGKTEGRKCSACNAVLKAQETVIATGHDEKSITAKATKTKNGKIVTKCETCKQTLSQKTIYKASGIKLSTTKYVYNGKTKSPKVVIKDSKGKTISSSNYTISKPSGRKKVGKYTYTVKLKNNYSGTVKLYMTINPKATSLKSLKAGKKSFTAKWSKVSSQATGYQLAYATDKKFTKNDKIFRTKSIKTVSKKISSLKSSKKYYVKVRTYKTVNGKRYYSAWSKVKTVKTK